MKLRVNYIDENDTPSQIRTFFERFGKVEEVAIYAADGLTYAVIDMPDKDAQLVLEQGRLRCWKGLINLEVKIANWYRGRWLSPNWRPPKEHCR